MWEAYRQCQAESRIPATVQMIRVEPDGRYWYQWVNSAYGTADVKAFISEKGRSTAERGPRAIRGSAAAADVALPLVDTGSRPGSTQRC